MATVEMFKSKISSKKFRENQKVWISHNAGNFLMIYFKWRGKGRYVRQSMSKWNNNHSDWHKAIGEEGLKQIEVSEEFKKKIYKKK